MMISSLSLQSIDELTINIHVSYVTIASKLSSTATFASYPPRYNCWICALDLPLLSIIAN